MDDQLAALAASAATSVVNSLATDAWEWVRAGVVGLWARYHPAPDDGPGAALDDARTRLVGPGHEGVEPALVAVWEERFRRLLEAEPAAAQALAQLVADLASEPRVDGAGETAVSRTEMRAEASGNGQVFQAGNNITNIRCP